MWWQLGLVSDAVMALVYLLIALAIVLPLARSHQLRTNPLGVTTAAIFFACAVHHGAHTVDLLLPSLGVDGSGGLALRKAWGWPLAVWDAAGAVVAVYYWSLRRNYSSLDRRAQLFEDLLPARAAGAGAQRQRPAGLIVAKMGCDLDDPDRANEALTTSIDSASRIITELLGSEQSSIALLRSSPAAVHRVADNGPGPHKGQPNELHLEPPAPATGRHHRRHPTCGSCCAWP